MEDEIHKLSKIFYKKDFNFTCIYKITSPSGKIYIGQTQAFYVRMKDYRKKNVNRYIEKAINKYGLENMFVEILEKDLKISILNEREQYYFNKFQPFGNRGYNIATEAGSNRGFKHTEDTKKIMSVKHKGRRKSEETLLRMSKAKKGISNPKLSIAQQKCVNQVCLKTGNILNKFVSQKEAEEKTGVSQTSISKIINKIPLKSRGTTYFRKSAGGFLWEYCDEDKKETNE